MNKVFRIVRNNKGAVALVALLGGAPAFAAGLDFSTLTGSVDFSTVVTALLAIAALMMLPKVASWGAKKVLGFIRG